MADFIGIFIGGVLVLIIAFKTNLIENWDRDKNKNREEEKGEYNY